MARTLADALAAAAGRGAVVTDPARWQAYAARHGEDAAVRWVDALEGSPYRTGRTVSAAQAYPTMAALPAVPPPANDQDLYSSLALMAEMRRGRPALVQAALAENPNYPRLFGNADLPPITASGMPVAVLPGQPWPLRRLLAGVSTLPDAYALLDQFSEDPGACRIDDGCARANSGYISAFRTWLAGIGTQPAGAYSTDQLHAELFGQVDWPS